MARLGLGPRWACLFANDLDPKKAAVYRLNFGGEDFHQGDVWDVQADQLPGTADLAWASFPCQDLSLAGRREGLGGERSGTFYGFWRLMEDLRAEGRCPRVVVLENVSGVLTSNGGHDFREIVSCLHDAGWTYGALELDAARFLPQSRPRLFFVAVRGSAPADLGVGGDLLDRDAPPAFGRTSAVAAAVKRLPKNLRAGWVWWRTPEPPARNTALIDVLDDDVPDSLWHAKKDTRRLISLMAPLHRERLEAARAAGERRVGAAFRRMRVENGERVQRVEARFDGLAGCLRTPAGGSSRQFLFVCDDGDIRSRVLTPRETARLMGLPDDYALPDGATAALSVTGDGLAAPVVRWLAATLIEPLLAEAPAEAAA